jgi:hypothetical protein
MSGDHATSANTTIDRLERLMRELDLICPEADRLGVIAQARDEAFGLDDGAAAAALAASLLVLCARSSLPDAGRLKRLVTGAGISGMALLHETLRTPELVMLDPELAYRMATLLLAGCAPVVEASLWTVDENQQPRCSAAAGEPVGARLTRRRRTHRDRRRARRRATRGTRRPPGARCRDPGARLRSRGGACACPRAGARDPVGPQRGRRARSLRGR